MRRHIAWSLAHKAARLIHDQSPKRNFDLLLFGSLARKSCGEVGDVDLLIIQSCENNDFEVYAYYTDKPQPPAIPPIWPPHEPMYYEDSTDLLHLLTFPQTIFTSETVQERIATVQHDKHFLRNCFSTIQRYDCHSKRFVHTNLSYFERQYGARLTSLR